MPIERHSPNDQPAKHEDAASWIDEVYDDVASKTKDVTSETVAFVKDHPAESALVGGLLIVAAAAALRGKPGLAQSEIAATRTALGGSAEKLVAEKLAAEKLVVSSAHEAGEVSAKVVFEAPALQRKTVEGTIIPDVVRPMMEKGKSLVTPEALSEVGKKYAGSLDDLFKLPKQMIVEDGHTMTQVATSALKARGATTGERFTEAAVTAEAERLLALNPVLKEATSIGGMKITVLDQNHLTKLAGGDLQFKFTPQLGQFLKSTGKITEEHISEAMALQKGGNKKMLGEILVDLNHATKADVDAAFADQNIMKAALKEVREQFLKTLN